MTDSDDLKAAHRPVDDRIGRMIVALAPIVALVLFFAFGFAGGWAWSWLFFMLVPIAYIVARGIRGRV